MYLISFYGIDVKSIIMVCKVGVKQIARFALHRSKPQSVPPLTQLDSASLQAASRAPHAPLTQLDSASLLLAVGHSPPYNENTKAAEIHKCISTALYFRYARLIAYSNSIVATGFGVSS